MIGPFLTAPPSSGQLALASLGLFLLDALVAGMLLFFVIDRYAPPQDLFWKPLSIDHPIGLATGRKIARLSGDPAACKAVLADGGVRVSEVPSRRDGFCSTLGAVRITAGVTPLSPAGPVMTCRQALSLSIFDRQVLAPAARGILDAEVARIDHYGTYACRRVYGRTTGRVSEHAHANAFDLAGVVLKDGRRITVAADFRDEGADGAFIRTVRDGACDVFRTVLSPDYNAAHRDHLHLDMGRFSVCR